MLSFSCPCLLVLFSSCLLVVARFVLGVVTVVVSCVISVVCGTVSFFLTKWILVAVVVPLWFRFVATVDLFVARQQPDVRYSMSETVCRMVTLFPSFFLWHCGIALFFSSFAVVCRVSSSFKLISGNLLARGSLSFGSFGTVSECRVLFSVSFCCAES